MSAHRRKSRKSQASSRRPSVSESKSARSSIVTARAKATYQRALNLLSDLRRGKGPFSQLLHEHHLSSRKAHNLLGRDLIGGGRGKPVRASKADRRVRELLFPKSVGDVRMRVRGSREATKLSEFFIDRKKLLRNELSAHDFEAKWHGVRVVGQELFTDVTAILGMADADVLKLEDLYGSIGGAR